MSDNDDHRYVPAHDGTASCTGCGWESRRIGIASTTQHDAHLEDVARKTAAPITPDERATMRETIATLDAAWEADDPTRPLVTEHATLTLLAHVASAVPRLLDALDTAEARGRMAETNLTVAGRALGKALTEAARLREEAARPAPVWDEDTVREAVACELFMRGTGLDAEDFCEAAEVIRGIWRQTADAVLYIAQRHLPVRPDSMAVIAAVRAEYGDVWDTPVPEVGKTVGWIIANATLPILDAWPGESRAQVEAEALRAAAEELDWPYDEIARLNSWEAVTVVLGALRARADRIEKGADRG